MGLTRYEMETIITYNAEEGMAELYTRDKSVMNKIDKMVAKQPDVYKLLKEDDWGKTYQFPKRLISFRQLVKKEMSEEERARKSELMKELCAKKVLR